MLCMPYIISKIFLATVFIVFAIISVGLYFVLQNILGSSSIFAVVLIAPFALILFFILLLAIPTYFHGVAIKLVKKTLDGGEIAFSDCFKLEKTKATNIILLHIVYGIILTFLGFGVGFFDAILKSSLSILLTAAASCIFIYSGYEIVISNKNWSDALKGGYNLFKKNKVYTFVVWVYTYYLSIYAGIVSFSLLLLVGGLLLIAFGLTNLPPLGFISVFGAFLFVLMITTSIIIQTAITSILYFAYGEVVEND